MKLSIIIPVYNTEKYLKECLMSIFSELDENIEVILIDDGSTDNSKLIYEMYDFKNFRKFTNENHGVSYSRNYGIDNSHGEWIMFVDSDDILRRGWKKSVFDNLDKDNDIIYFSNNFDTKKMNNISKAELIENILGMKNNNTYLSTPWSKVFKREKINSLRFDTKIINGEDMLFNISVLENVNCFKFVCESIYCYRFNVDSISHKYNSKLLDSDIRFHGILRKLLVQNNVDEKIMNKICEFCLYNGYLTLLNNFSKLNFSLYKEKIKCFKDIPYCQLTVKNNGIKDFMIKQIKKEKYMIPFLFFKIKNKMKNTEKKGSIVEI